MQGKWDEGERVSIDESIVVLLERICKRSIETSVCWKG